MSSICLTTVIRIWFKYGGSVPLKKLGNLTEPEPQRTTVTVLKLTEGLGLTEAGIRVFEDINWNGQ